MSLVSSIIGHPWLLTCPDSQPWWLVSSKAQNPTFKTHVGCDYHCSPFSKGGEAKPDVLNATWQRWEKQNKRKHTNLPVPRRFWGKKEEEMHLPQGWSIPSGQIHSGAPTARVCMLCLSASTPCKVRRSVARTPVPGFSNFRLMMCKRAAGGSEKERQKLRSKVLGRGATCLEEPSTQGHTNAGSTSFHRELPFQFGTKDPEAGWPDFAYWGICKNSNSSTFLTLQTAHRLFLIPLFPWTMSPANREGWEASLLSSTPPLDFSP